MRRTSLLSRGISVSPCDALAELHRRIGSSFEGAVFTLLARSPGNLRSFLSLVQSAYDVCAVHSAADQLAEQAASATDEMRFSDHLAWLAEQGYSREASRQIRYLVESFCALEPVFAILTSTARHWLSGVWGRAVVPVVECERVPCSCPGPIEFAPEDCVPESLRALSGSRGPTHLLHRGLAVWPDYAAKAAEDCARLGPRFGDAAAVIRASADELGGRTAAMLAGPPPTNASCATLVELDDCLWSSCDALALATILRSGFIAGETRARHRLGVRSFA